ncbi:MAG TPA: gamma-glutamylcyclotransferase [Micromonosporaceae bacterium]
MALLFLNGGGMRDGPLHHQLRGAPLVGVARTAPKYRYYSVDDRFPALDATDGDGVSVIGELYDVPLDVLRESLLPAEPPELELAVVELADGASALATVLRRDLPGSTELTDISHVADWRAYLATREPAR